MQLLGILLHPEEKHPWELASLDLQVHSLSQHTHLLEATHTPTFKSCESSNGKQSVTDIGMG
jgi:hypothetical protein